MGQRSQIYFRINKPDGKYDLIARYYQWNYGTRMVSRARHTIQWIIQNKKYPFMFQKGMDGHKKLARIMDVNFDYHDVVLSLDILKEYEEGYYTETGEIFTGQDNNDGQLLINMHVDYDKKDKEGNDKVTIKYAFLDYSSEYLGNADKYMQWNTHYGEEGEPWRENSYIKDEVKYTDRNINYLEKHAKLMTEDEVKEYINHDYVADMNIKVKESE